ncbi:RNA polymerase sigma factor [Flavivirga eckloniae]|uniref:RNA polymerase sigma factor 70 region 4 type 2 domain-containing protein n=1 Tax=Flavivirga eckloniae TaxID=1803846 RepID=A0A2K9PV49_9FLAO|nr:sigma-70 family RNA polymerase sigma factor [Flavivirga eckloniae]AUP80688.1 hypothetical protein C1H87_19005 [Flavivirga eckloniae]
MKADKKAYLEHNLSDSIIWAKIKQGDTGALGELYDRYVDDLFLYGLKQTKEKDYIEDCIHDLFLDLYKYKAKLADTDNVKYYLLKSLKRKIIKKYNKKVVPIQSDDSLSILQSSTNSIESEESKIINSESILKQSMMLEGALKELTEKQRKSVILRIVEDMPYEEIAQIMGISVPSVRTNIYRALKLLRKSPILFLIFTASGMSFIKWLF